MRSMLLSSLLIVLVAGSAFAEGDFNLDGVTNLSGDGAAVLQNLESGGANLANDMAEVISGLATDVVPNGTAIYYYYPVTGEVWFSSSDPGDGSGPLQLVFYSLNNELTGVDAPKTTVAYKLQLGTTKDISGLPGSLAYFNGDGFTLNSKSAGFIVAPGTPYEHVWMTYQNAGQDPVFYQYTPPEPSSVILAGIAGVSLFVVARRRRVAKAL